MNKNSTAVTMAAFIALGVLTLIASPSTADFAVRSALLVGDQAVPYVQLLEAKGKTGDSTSVPTNYGCAILPAGKALVTPADGLTLLKVPTSVCYLCDMRTPNTCIVQTPESLMGTRFTN